MGLGTNTQTGQRSSLDTAKQPLVRILRVQSAGRILDPQLCDAGQVTCSLCLAFHLHNGHNPTTVGGGLLKNQMG